MKKWLFLALFLAPALATADVLRSSKEEPVLVKFDANVRISSSIILIDLSSTSMTGGIFPHMNKGSINIFEPSVTVDKFSAASSGTVRLGVLTTVNAATGTVTWFYSATPSNLSEIAPLDTWAYRTRVDRNAATPFILSSTKTVASTTYQNDTGLAGLSTNDATPEVGDIILEITNGGQNVGPLKVNVGIKYNSEP